MSTSRVKSSKVASGHNNRTRAGGQKLRQPSNDETELERLLSILRKTVAAQIAANSEGEDWSGDQSEAD